MKHYALKKHYEQLLGYTLVEVIILEDEEDTEFPMDEPRVVLMYEHKKTKMKKEIAPIVVTIVLRRNKCVFGKQ